MEGQHFWTQLCPFWNIGLELTSRINLNYHCEITLLREAYVRRLSSDRRDSHFEKSWSATDVRNFPKVLFTSFVVTGADECLINYRCRGNKWTCVSGRRFHLPCGLRRPIRKLFFRYIKFSSLRPPTLLLPLSKPSSNPSTSERRVKLFQPLLNFHL